MPSSQKHSPFDEDIIIDFLYENGKFSTNALRLARKYSLNMTLIEGGNFANEVRDSNFILPIKSAHKKIRIYVIGHSLPAADTLRISNRKYIHFSDLATCLTRFIGNKNNDITVNLVSCFSGRGSIHANPTDSFGAKLHRVLAENIGKNIPVVARNEAICVVSECRSNYDYGVKKAEIHKSTTKHGISKKEIADLLRARDAAPPNSHERKRLNIQMGKQYAWQQSGSKVLFTTDKNKNQICHDAYCSQFKSRVIKTLKESLSHNHRMDKKNFLLSWEKQFASLNDKKISEIIEIELNNPNSVLKKHANPFWHFFKNANTYTKFKDLLEKRQRSLLSPLKTIRTYHQLSI